MQSKTKTLFLEINYYNFIFSVIQNDESNNSIKIFEKKVAINGIENDRFTNFDLVSKIIKENIFLIEQNLNYTFKEVIIILENFNPTFINLSGYKKLNGSQILKENITYILNTLKSHVEKIETKKTILHIFNSKFYLDKKEIGNLPIGLFGDFYSHELSLIFIYTNDYKNLINVLSICNLKIKKILLKSFVQGVNLIENNKDIKTFFHIKFDKQKTKIFYFENSSLKFEQSFNFGTEIIVKDISKITFLKRRTVENILNGNIFKKELLDEDLIEERFFFDNDYRKIKKRLIYDISLSRIKELYDLILFKNSNFYHYNNKVKNLFLEINCEIQIKSLKEIYETSVSPEQNKEVKFVENSNSDFLLQSANKIVHFGWNKEAIPVLKTKKSLVARIFEAIFS